MSDLDVQSVEASSGGGAPSMMTVVCHGEVPDGIREYALERLGPVVAHVGAPVLFSRVKLTLEPDPARQLRAIAEVAVDVNGELVRAHIAAHELREAVDLLQRRLRSKLEHRAEHREAIRKRARVAEPGAWRHGDRPVARPDWFDRPVEERRVMRNKSFAVGACTPDEAIFDMEQADFDFYLFTELASGQDACIEHQDDTYLLTRQRPDSVELGPTAAEVRMSDLAAPELPVEAAIERLDVSGDRHLFFTDEASGRGSVLYRRYDGHYGLLTAT